LKEIAPRLSRIAVLWNPESPSSRQQWNEAQRWALKLGLQLHSMEVSTADKYDSSFKEATNALSDGLTVTLHALANSNQKRIAALAVKNRLPALYPRGDWLARKRRVDDLWA
jgi:putative tryptophan/tyrosine transport system substrate-binding protein